MSWLRVRDLGNSTHSEPEGHGHVRFQCHPRDGLANSLQSRQNGTRVVFQGDKHDILPQIVYESRCHGQLASWLASLTLEDEVRQDLDLP